MNAGDLAIAAAAGLAAGGMNVLVGSGTLITFPVLVAIGLPPIAANASSTVGLVAGSISGTIGYRDELVGRKAALRRFAPLVAAGSISGSAFVLLGPPELFERVVPWLILVATLLLMGRPVLAGWAQRRHADPSRGGGPGGITTVVGLVGAGAYGGYFGAGLGIVLLAVLSIVSDSSLQQDNAMKNALASITNILAAIVFVVGGAPRWSAALAVAGGAALGGLIGARLGRRTPDSVLRGFMITVGVVATLTILRQG